MTAAHPQGEIRPLLLGYIRAHLLMTDDEIAAAKLTLTAFAGSEGYALGTVYVEHPATTPAAFYALMDEVRRDNDVWAVVTPGPHHLPDGNHQAMRTHLDHHGAVHVLIAHP